MSGRPAPRAAAIKRGRVTPSPGRVALVAFAFHHPGVRLLFGLRQTSFTRRLNFALLGLTLIAAAAAVALSERSAWLFGLVAFACGHFAWSTCFAWLAFTRFDRTFERR